MLCYRCKTRHMLCGNCSVVSPTLEDSGMSFLGQCVTLLANQTSVESEPHDELPPSGARQDKSSALSEEIPGEENCRKDQFNPKETSQQEPEKLPLKGNKSMNTNQNLKKCSNSIEPIPNPTTYKKWWHNTQLCRITFGKSRIKERILDNLVISCHNGRMKRKVGS